MPTEKNGWFPGKLGPSRTQYMDLVERKSLKNLIVFSPNLSFSMNYSSTYLWKSVPNATGGYDNRRILGVVINITLCAPLRRSQSLSTHARSHAHLHRRMRFMLDYQFRRQACWCARVARDARDALPGLERLLIEQRPTRCQNEIKFSLEHFDDESIELY